MKTYRYEGMEHKYRIVSIAFYLAPTYKRILFFDRVGKDWDQLKGNVSNMKEYKKWKQRNASTSLIKTREGLGLWTPYPGNLDLVVLPTVVRSSKAG
ncbi:uncharacterized protein E5676_scaffold32G00890 [Cucumis melo var. makuwa]|uniref:Uncharacterized protein n=1 Tax=Cucumis melo var. makuwa TaxID=1194695 RepID=A0A5A7TIM5_CUCMM|nr:uncharacterized protein E6C27_scaffold128G002620 [Cucumis melo var. makuwa]TYK16071.1 uncharacterized protein E5676_scaffold32G00890 [Cucumis melo var. makuwa]